MNVADPEGHVEASAEHQRPTDLVLPEPEDRQACCRNCGEPVDLLFCPHCGQSTMAKRRSLRAILGDFVDEFLGVDSRLWRSLKMLMLRPGLLTLEFMRERHVSYVPASRLFIVSSILFFLTLALMTSGGNFGVDSHGNVVMRQDETAESHTAEPPDASVEPEFPEVEMEVGEIVQTPQKDGAESAVAPDSTMEASPESQDGEVAAESEESHRQSRVIITDDRFEGKNALTRWMNRRLDAQEAKLESMDPEALGPIILGLSIDYAPKVLFLIMPLFALILKMLYIRREPLYVDHFVFALHVHAFIFLMITLLIGINALLDSGWLLAFSILGVLFGTPAYICAAMKRAYQQTWIKTFIKCNLLMFMHFLLLLFGVVLVVFLAVFSV